MIGNKSLAITDNEIDDNIIQESKNIYELKQTRSADEAPTRFFECAKCGHKWRDYD